MQQVTRKTDPAPSRWSYRFQRLMLTPMFRQVLRVGLPFMITLIAGGWYLADDTRRDQIVLGLADMRNSIETRPEFMVNLMAVEGASTNIGEDIRAALPIDFPVSSFDLELEDIRQRVAALPAIEEVSVRIRAGGVLEVSVQEREPVVMWRTHRELAVLDRDGVALTTADSRGAYPDLPLVAGEGVEEHVDEALRLFRAAQPIHSRLRGLARMGERRWDVVLDRGQRIMLPEKNPVQALERVIALSHAQDMLKRDLIAVDMRLSARPTIRMNTQAIEKWWEITSNPSGN